MESNDPIAIVFNRNHFYRRKYHLALLSFFFMMVMLGLLLTIIAYLLKNPLYAIYFATDKASKLIQVVPINEPNMSTEEMMAWVSEAVVATHSYDYVNYREQTQAAEKYFTRFGWSSYLKTLQASNNLNSFQNKMIWQGQVGQPEITQEGSINGAHAWKLKIPLLVTYWSPPYDDAHKFSNAFTTIVLVVRQPVLESYNGLGIIQLIDTVPTG